nr:hypothetical protein [Tanacetum cinerariifolium]
GNSDDGVTIAYGAGKMEEVGIYGIEVEGDDDSDVTLLLHLVSIASSGVGDTCLSGKATVAAPTSGAAGTSVEIEPIRITRGKKDPTLSSDLSEEIK